MSDAIIRFHAALWRVTTDNEGESKITLVVPLSELPAILRLSQQTERELLVEITPQDV